MSLPALPLFGATIELGNNTIRTETDSPVAKTRQRFTVGVQHLSPTFLIIGQTDRATFESFFKTTLKGGALSFTVKNPHTESTVTCRFLSPPNITESAYEHFTVSCKLEVLP